MFSNARNLAGQAGALIMRFLAGWETHVQRIYHQRKTTVLAVYVYYTTQLLNMKTNVHADFKQKSKRPERKPGPLFEGQGMNLPWIVNGCF